MLRNFEIIPSFTINSNDQWLTYYPGVHENKEVDTLPTKRRQRSFSRQQSPAARLSDFYGSSGRRQKRDNLAKFFLDPATLVPGW